MALAPTDLGTNLESALPICLGTCEGPLGTGEKRKKSADQLSAEIIGALIVLKPQEYRALSKAFKARTKELSPEEMAKLRQKVREPLPSLKLNEKQRKILDEI